MRAIAGAPRQKMITSDPAIKMTITVSATAMVPRAESRAGILSSGALSTVRISNVMVVNNSFGVFAAGGGAIVSFGNNRIAGNATDGAPTVTPGQK
jgi:hypothetical protein